MFEFAQTNLQLYRQMAAKGYNETDREQVASAYRLLIPMFSGKYRGSEKPFLAHLVGTASVLAAYSAPSSVVVAGLMHAVYTSGDFGFQPGKGCTDRKRQYIRKVTGDEAEAIIATYDRMPWTKDSVETYRSEYDQQSKNFKHAINMALANTLEDLLDYGVSYYRGSKFELLSSAAMQDAVVSLARERSWPGLDGRLAQEFAALNSRKPPVTAAGAVGTSGLLLPPSSRRKLIPVGTSWVARRWRRIKPGPR